MTNINKIKSAINLGNGVAQGCHYICNILPPVSIQRVANQRGIGAIANFAQRQISLMAEATSIPGRKLATTPHRIFGTQREMPYGTLYEPLTVTFICTNLMVERLFFDIWQQFIISPSNQYMEYYKDYVGEIVIQKIPNDSVGAKVFGALPTYFIEEAYPVSIASQELSYNDAEYLTLTVEFAYARWRNTLDKLFPGDNSIPIFDYI